MNESNGKMSVSRKYQLTKSIQWNKVEMPTHIRPDSMWKKTLYEYHNIYLYVFSLEIIPTCLFYFNSLFISLARDFYLSNIYANGYT